MADDLEKRLIDLVAGAFGDPARQTALRPETRLFDGGIGLDSFAVVEMIGLLEDTFEIEFSDSDFTPGNFVDFRSLAALVRRYLPEAG